MEELAEWLSEHIYDQDQTREQFKNFAALQIQEVVNRAHAEGYEAGVCFGLTDAGYDKGYADAIADAAKGIESRIFRSNAEYVSTMNLLVALSEIRDLRPKEK